VHDGVRPLTQSERPLGREEVDERFYAIVTDLVGAPTELADADGGIVWRRRASVWGAADPVGDLDCPLRFPGQYHDAETGLDYNLHRYYDPETGRYQSPDPLGLAPQPNPHAYVHNPTVAADPLGLMGCGVGDPLTLNLGGEGEVAGAINLNTLIAPLRSPESIRESGLLVVGSMERIPFADEVFDRVVGNKMPFMHGEFPQNVANEAYRVLRPGGTVQLAASNVGGTAWVPYLERARFMEIQVQGRHAMGVRP
jgi:RHS repeat-associated protein